MSTLNGGASLAVGQGITSPNGRYSLTLASDGALKLTDGSGAIAWSTDTAGKGATRADFQADGNFVLYTAQNGVVWASNTGAAGSTLELQDDRNLVIYGRDRAVVWSPNTYITAEEKARLDAADEAARAAEAQRVEAERAAAAAAAVPAAPAPAPAPERRYVVQRGDTLSKIAKQFYGNAGEYRRIAAANNIANPDLIHPGQDLLIP